MDFIVVFLKLIIETVLLNLLSTVDKFSLRVKKLLLMLLSDVGKFPLGIPVNFVNHLFVFFIDSVLHVGNISNFDL